MNYRRAFIQNSFIHIIITSYKRKPVFIDNIQLLRTAFKKTMQNYTFEIVAICVLPEHIHIILNPKNINEYPKIISSIKHLFSRNIDINKTDVDSLKRGYINKREKGIFQRRFFEHTILNEDELKNEIEYIHFNPVKHRLVKNVKDWKYSSFHKFKRQGIYPENWGENVEIQTICNIEIE